jgi:hypothetical protein
MGKSRKLVPVALYSEVAEYTSLLRSLKTNNTLDISYRLAKPHTPSSALFIEPQSSNEREPEQSLTESAADALSLHPSADSSKQVAGSSASETPAKTRDTWTRWPLLAGDVHMPEWSFEEEVHLVAKQCLASLTVPHDPLVARGADARSDPGGVFDHSPDQDNEIDDDDMLSPSTLRILADQCSLHLGQILSCLAAHVPLAGKSMQNRLQPVGWEDVLGIMSVSGLVGEQSVLRSNHFTVQHI